MRYSAYPKYRDSGVDWLGEIPVEWEVIALKRKILIVNGSTPKSSESENWDGDIIWVTPADLSKTSIKFVYDSQRKITIDGLNSCGTKLVPIKSIILSTRAPIGTVALSAVVLCTNQGCKSLVKDSTDIYEDYIYYQILVSDVQLNSLGSGTTFKELSYDSLSMYKIVLPSISMQKAITEFLDKKTSQIDVLIEKKKDLIKKLKEQRMALITKAVTKGLDDSVPMKDSGVDWLGKIPEGWEVRRLRFAVKTNPVKSEITGLKADDPVSFIPMEAVGEYGGLSFEAERSFEEVYSGYTYFKDKDVLIAKITPCFENGKGAIADKLTNGIGFGTTEFHVIRSDADYYEGYLFYLTITYPFRVIGASVMLGAGGQKRIPESFIKDFRVGFPDLREQKFIAEFLDKKTSQIDALIKKAEEVIEKLKEYRMTLITDAVTGKIKVS